ncbi:tRNA (guanine-1-)-methyltransferase [Candidatus Desulfarcum epimagneticum]|uniref:tRNA (guanine-N(1)-)-methyltransferase n=1 Tax=uncultured Desulfobacteraceae bacterium TaxID=218296 RepID=A0A484HKW3_9BACT|nr:tRNA (guanine-1-)-methyltransferase [uncultured Desulfobacteraceae bacterium]
MDLIVLTLFPGMFDAFWEHGIIRRAVSNGKIRARAIDIRDCAEGKHRTADDRPYGGGCGMVMKPDPIARAMGRAMEKAPGARRVLLTPQGRTLDQGLVEKLAGLEGMILVCGRYEGVDERLREHHIDDEISVGDYVLSGGETAAMILMDSVVRMIPGALGSRESALEDSFSNDRLKHPQYTRPRVFEGSETPGVLLSGDHGRIKMWRAEMSLAHTLINKPDLLEKRPPDEMETKILKKWRGNIDRILESLHGPGPLPGGR